MSLEYKHIIQLVQWFGLPEAKTKYEKEAVTWFLNLEPEARLAQLKFRYFDWVKDQRENYETK